MFWSSGQFISPFLIMCIVSIPAMMILALQNVLKRIIGRVIRLSDFGGNGPSVRFVQNRSQGLILIAGGLCKSASTLAVGQSDSHQIGKRSTNYALSVRREI